MRIKFLGSLAFLFLLAACSDRLSYSRLEGPGLPPYPAGAVTGQPLPPPENPQQSPTDENLVAAVPPPALDPSKAVDVRRPDLAGGWTIASGGESCQLFMNLTSWSGGYRANTRGCNSDELKAVGAWDLNGKEIVLKDATGSPIARLYASAPTRFSGQTVVSGRGILVYR